MRFSEVVPLLMSGIIIKNNSGPRTVPLENHLNGTSIAYTTWYSNMVGSVS